MPYKDLEQRRAYHREWEARNKDKTKAYWKKKYAKHRDKILEKGRAYRSTLPHKEKDLERWYERTPELEGKRKLRRLWNDSPRSRRRFKRHSAYLSFEKYESLLQQLEGGGPCDCCGRNGLKMHIDHCHKEMKFRGVLCAMCNKGLGHFGDSIELMHKAIAYLSQNL